MSLWRREFLSLAANVLTNSPKILQITKRDFFNSISFTVINKYDRGAAVQMSTVFGTVYHVACQKVFWKDL